MNGLQLSPLMDTDRIFALPDRASREAALLRMESNRRDMVSHFLVLKYAKTLCEAVPRGAHDQVIEQIPAQLVEAVKPLARSYIQAAKIVANNNAGGRSRDGDT